MFSIKARPCMILFVFLLMAMQVTTHAVEVNGDGVHASVDINQGSKFTKLSLFPLLKLEQYEGNESDPDIVHMEIFEIPFVENIIVSDKKNRNTRGCCHLISDETKAENDNAPFRTQRHDMPLFSLIDAVIVDDEPFIQAKIIDSPVFTLLAETRHGDNLENRQWEAFDIPLITTLAYQKNDQGTTRQFMNTPLGNVYKSTVWADGGSAKTILFNEFMNHPAKDASGLAILNMNLVSLYKSSTRNQKTQRSLLTSGWTFIDAPLFGIWSSKDTDLPGWTDHRFLTLPLIGSLWSMETHDNKRTMRIFRIPIAKGNYQIERIDK